MRVHAYACTRTHVYAVGLGVVVLDAYGIVLQAWCLLLADWGYGGHFYEGKELEVLEGDLDSLRQYVTDNEISLEVSRPDFLDFCLSVGLTSTVTVTVLTI